MIEQNEPTEPWNDPIVAEVRRHREALFAEAGYDVRELCRRLRERQEISGHRVLKREKAVPASNRD
jgi:hypothetical protein